MGKTKLPIATDTQIREFKQLPNDTVKRCSTWTVEASRYIHFTSYKLLATGTEFDNQPEQEYFRKYFQQLQNIPPKAQRNKIDPE